VAPVPKVHGDGVVGAGKSAPVVPSKPSTPGVGNWEYPTIEKNNVRINKIIFFIKNIN
jgi:hypothetical protein